MATQVGFPKELSNEISYSLPPSVTSYNIKVVPSNLSQVQTAAQTLTASQAGLQLNGTSSNIIFDIPCGQSKSQFIDPRYTLLNFRVRYSVTNTPSSAVITAAQLRSHAMAHFDRTYTQSNGVVLDDVNNLGVIADLLLQNEVDVASRDVLSVMLGTQYETALDASGNISTNQGHRINGIHGQTLSAATDRYYSYSIPLLNSLIGKGASKMFNHGSVSNLQVVMQTAAILPITFVTGSATTAAVFQATIDNISLSMQVVDVGSEGLRMLNKGGVQYFDGITYRASTATIPAGTSGVVSLLTGLRASSVRSLFARFTEATTLTTAGCINQIFDSKAPLATSIAWNINGQLIPSNPTDIVRNPAQCFSQTQMAIGSFNNYEFKSGLVPSQYFIYLPTSGSLPSDADQVFTVAGTASSFANQAQFCFGYSLEKVAKAGILDGINLSSGNTFLNMTLAAANSNTVTAYFISKNDVIYVLDSVTGQMQVRF